MIAFILASIFAATAAGDTHSRVLLVSSRAQPVRNRYTNAAEKVSPRISPGGFAGPWVPIAGPNYATPSNSFKISPTEGKLSPHIGTRAYNWAAFPAGLTPSTHVPIATTLVSSVPAVAATLDVYAQQLPHIEYLNGLGTAGQLLGLDAAYLASDLYLPYGDLGLHNAYLNTR